MSSRFSDASQLETHTPTPRRSTPQRSLLCAALLAALPLGAAAAELEYEVGARLLRTDNIALSESNEISESVLSPRLRFGFTHDSPVLQTELSGDVQYLDYLDETFDDDTRGEFSGDLNWVILPQRLTFVVQDSLSRQSVDNLVAFSPGNQQQINVFVAGPSLFARFGDTTLGQLDLRYTNSYAEETESFNSDRYNVAARVERQLNPTDTLALNAEATRIEFDTVSPAFDYDRYEAYASYRSVLASVDIDVDLGYTKLEPKGGSGGSSGPLFRGSLDWRPSQRSEFNLDASYQFADAAQDLIVRVGDPPDPVVGVPGDPDLQIVPDTFRERRLTLGYRYAGERLNLQIQPYYSRLNYVDGVAFDQENRGATVDATFRLRAQLSLSFVAGWQQREFKAVAREDEDLTLGIGLANQFSRHWSGRADVQYRERDSSTVGQNYTENVVAISFAYRR
jgi:hypothetical protein